MNELSQKAGIGLTTVIYIERGIRSPSLDSLLRIANVLDVELWQLIREATAKAVHSRKHENRPIPRSARGMQQGDFGK